jgi:hypothetical protein
VNADILFCKVSQTEDGLTYDKTNYKNAYILGSHALYLDFNALPITSGPVA